MRNSVLFQVLLSSLLSSAVLSAQTFPKDLHLQFSYGLTSAPSLTVAPSGAPRNVGFEGLADLSASFVLTKEQALSNSQWAIHYGVSGGLSGHRIGFTQAAAFNSAIPAPFDGARQEDIDYSSRYIGLIGGVSRYFPVGKKDVAQFVVDGSLLVGYLFGAERTDTYSTIAFGTGTDRPYATVAQQTKAQPFAAPVLQLRWQRRLNDRIDWTLGLRAAISWATTVESTLVLIGDNKNIEATSEKTFDQLGLLLGVAF